MASKFSKKFTHWLVLHLAIPLIYCLYRLVTLTLRVEHRGEKAFQNFKQGNHVVCAFFHCDSCAMAVLMQCFLQQGFGRVFLIVSQSRDGDLMAKFLEMAGGVPLRGSSSRGGARVLLAMKRGIGTTDNAAIAVDGPRGPRFEMKQGAVMLASLAQQPIMPVAVRLSRKWTARSWDRMEFPLPFSRVTAYYGDPVGGAAECRCGDDGCH